MAHPSKRKGNRFERELREAFREAGLRAERAYASNGESLTTDGGASERQQQEALATWAPRPGARPCACSFTCPTGALEARGAERA
jgi:hypothetical protein